MGYLDMMSKGEMVGRIRLLQGRSRYSFRGSLSDIGMFTSGLQICCNRDDALGPVFL